MRQPKIKTAEQLRTSLLNQFELIEEGKGDLEKAKELNRTAGNILHSAKMELQYAKHKEDKRDIEFLGPPKAE